MPWWWLVMVLCRTMYHGSPLKAISGYRSPTRLQEGRKIVTVKDVEPEKFITAFSQHLKRQGLDLPGLMSDNLFLERIRLKSQRGFLFPRTSTPKNQSSLLSYIYIDYSISISLQKITNAIWSISLSWFFAFLVGHLLNQVALSCPSGLM